MNPDVRAVRITMATEIIDEVLGTVVNARHASPVLFGFYPSTQALFLCI